jgi:Dolichyl-phosphate-mannose-protein mannosyltransferase
MTLRSLAGRTGRFLAHPGTITVAAFLIRYGLFYYRASNWPRPVSGSYQFGAETGRLARALAAGEGFSSPLNADTGPSAWMTPLYPLLLAGIFKVYGIYSWASFLVITSLDCAFSALTAWPVWAIARRAFGTSSGVAAAWIWAVLPSAVFFPVAWVWDTSLTALAFALIVLATMEVQDTERAGAWAGYGVLWGAGAMVNASVVATMPFLLGWATHELRARSARWMKPALVGLMAFGVVISPWFIRNYVVFHRLILFRSNFGLELWLGNNPRNPGVWSWWLHPNDDDAERKIFTQLGEIPYMELRQRQAEAWIRAHPREFAHDTFHRFMDNWTGFDEPLEDLLNRPWDSVSIFLVDLIFPLLALPGALLAYRRRNAYAFPFASAIMFFPLVYYVTHTSLRYRHPIDPLLCVLAAYSLVTAGSWVGGRIFRTPAVAGAASHDREMAAASERLP